MDGNDHHADHARRRFTLDGTQRFARHRVDGENHDRRRLIAVGPDRRENGLVGPIRKRRRGISDPPLGYLDREELFRCAVRANGRRQERKVGKKRQSERANGRHRRVLFFGKRREDGVGLRRDDRSAQAYAARDCPKTRGGGTLRRTLGATHSVRLCADPHLARFYIDARSRDPPAQVPILSDGAAWELLPAPRRCGMSRFFSCLLIFVFVQALWSQDEPSGPVCRVTILENTVGQPDEQRDGTVLLRVFVSASSSCRSGEVGVAAFPSAVCRKVPQTDLDNSKPMTFSYDPPVLKLTITPGNISTGVIDDQQRRFRGLQLQLAHRRLLGRRPARRPLCGPRLDRPAARAREARRSQAAVQSAALRRPERLQSGCASLLRSPRPLRARAAGPDQGRHHRARHLACAGVHAHPQRRLG